jgi:hypothetical protein
MNRSGLTSFLTSFVEEIIRNQLVFIEDMDPSGLAESSAEDRLRPNVSSCH